MKKLLLVTVLLLIAISSRGEEVVFDFDAVLLQCKNVLMPIVFFDFKKLSPIVSLGSYFSGEGITSTQK